MKGLSEIANFLDNYLNISEFRDKDDSWNGLQVEANDKVKKVGVAVDACFKTIKKAGLLGCELLIVHHGIFWKNSNPSFRQAVKKKVDALLKGGVSLYACHLPLDAHNVVGNNAQFLRLFGASPKQDFCDIGKIGVLPKSVPVRSFKSGVESKLDTTCELLKFGKDKVKKVGVVTGGGGYGCVSEAVSAGVDVFVTGDTTYLEVIAEDNEVNIIFAGHYHTETLGVKALAELLSKRFNLRSVFIPVERTLL